MSWTDWLTGLFSGQRPAADETEALADAYVRAVVSQRTYGTDAVELDAAATILELEAEDRVRVARRLWELLTGPGLHRSQVWFEHQGIGALLNRIHRSRLPYTPELLTDVFARLSTLESWDAVGLGGLARNLEWALDDHPATDILREAVELFVEAHPDAPSAERRQILRIADAIGVDDGPFTDDPWLSALSDEERPGWDALLAHARTAGGRSLPSDRWMEEAEVGLDGVEPETLREQLVQRMERVKLGPTPGNTWAGQEAGAPPEERDLLKGLVWMARDPALATPLGRFAERCYKKIKGHGAGSIALGNAAVVALGNLPEQAGVPQLTRLSRRVRYQAARRAIDQALERAAEAASVSREDLEEQSAPTFGLDETARKEVRVGDATAVVQLSATDVEIRWRKRSGRLQKTAPKAVRESYPDTVSALRSERKEILELLHGYRDRMEQLRLQGRSLTYQDLLDRYLRHPLLGAVARTLIWEVQVDGSWVAGMWSDGALRALGGAPMEAALDAEARLWHLIDHADELETLMVWRDWLDERGIQQPFKQVWREVYQPEDPTADRDSRFDGQIVEQHPFHAICQRIGWRYRLQGKFDSANDPERWLEDQGLVARLAVSPVEHQSDDVVFTYVQINELQIFRPDDGVWLPLGEVDPLVFSEVMRDVDLLVSSCNVARDPDFFREGATRFWGQEAVQAAVGRLSPLARTRKGVLNRVIPRVSIGSQLELEGKHLLVHDPRGETWRIHLGTTEVRRQGRVYPSQIPLSRSVKTAVSKVFLPFEGDGLLVDILGKAFQLATDPPV